MISILIPVYNFDVRPLVAELHRQALEYGIAMELICFDDGSQVHFKEVHTAALLSMPGVIYQELPQNVGRSRIRNMLAEAAHGDFLLFMDGDSGVCQPDYLLQYAQAAQAGKVLYGGRVYSQLPPANPAFYLHWYYGRKREQVPALVRQSAPYQGFMTNNFLIPKKVFLEIGFDERLRNYGHEDTLFGMELQKRGVPIIHFDNPLEHLGLEEAPVFLEKAAQAVANLVLINQSGANIDTRLLGFYEQLKNWHVVPLFQQLGNWCFSFLRRNLLSKRPSLLVFDLYKLALLLRMGS